MTKSKLIETLAKRQKHLSHKDIDSSVKTILEYISSTLSEGGRVEIRGFGSFCLHYRQPRLGRNPKSGEPIMLAAKYVPHFKPGKELRRRVNNSNELPPKDET